ncbi:DUF4194 domain-containing protein [Clostridium sp. Marseille-QA1073]
MEIFELDKLTEESKELFKKVIQTIISKTYIIEKRYHKDKNLYRDRMYSFIEEYESIVKEYLNLGGFDLKSDSNNGVYYIESDNFRNNINFSKLATIFLLLIRLMYDEKQESVSIGLFTTFRYSELLKSINIFNLSTKLLSESKQIEALKTLIKYNFIEKVDGLYTDPSSVYVIYPSIIHCIDGNAVRGILEEFKEKIESNNPEETISIGDDLDEIYN